MPCAGRYAGHLSKWGLCGRSQRRFKRMRPKEAPNERSHRCFKRKKSKGDPLLFESKGVISKKNKAQSKTCRPKLDRRVLNAQSKTCDSSLYLRVLQAQSKLVVGLIEGHYLTTNRRTLLSCQLKDTLLRFKIFLFL